MIFAINESLGDMEGLTAIQFGRRDFYYVTGNQKFVFWYQWRDADGIYGFGDRSCSFVDYSQNRDGTISCSREYHIGKTILRLEYDAPNMAHKINDDVQMRYLFPKVSLKGLLKKIYR